MSMGRARGSNKLLYKEAAPRSEPYQLCRVLLTGKAFLSYVAPSLKTSLTILMWPYYI